MVTRNARHNMCPLAAKNLPFYTNSWTSIEISLFHVQRDAVLSGEWGAEALSALFDQIAWLAFTNKSNSCDDSLGPVFGLFLRQTLFVSPTKNSWKWRFSRALEIRPQISLLRRAPQMQINSIFSVYCTQKGQRTRTHFFPRLSSITFARRLLGILQVFSCLRTMLLTSRKSEPWCWGFSGFYTCMDYMPPRNRAWDRSFWGA